MKLNYNRIIFVTVSMAGGGTERVIATLSNYLVGQGYEVTIMQIAEATMAYELDERVKVVRVGQTSGGSIKKRIERITNMRRIFKEQKPANIIAMGTVCSIFAGIANWGIKGNFLAMSERNRPDRINKKPYKWWSRAIRNIIYRTADALVLQTEASKEFFPKGIVKKSHIIGNPVSSNIPIAYDGIRDKRIVSAGRLTDDKNYHLLLDAFKDFLKFHPEYTLEIYGKGEMEEALKNYIKEIEIEQNAAIVPFASDLHEKIKKAAMFISSSDTEGISNSIMEALALGIPVIGTDCPIGGTAMMVEDGINGFLVPVKDREAMVSCMRRIADDDELAKRLSMQGRKIRENWSEKVICDKWLEIMN